MHSSIVAQEPVLLAKQTSNEIGHEARLRDCVDRITARDQSGLVELFNETGAMVYGFAMRMLSSSADAEEVTSDVYAQIWRSAPDYREIRGSVLSWLAIMARSRSIDRLRTRGFRARNDYPLSAVEHLQATGSEESSVDRLDGQRLRQAFRCLPSEQRVVVTLAYFSGMSHSEIANHLAIPIGTVKTRIRLGMSKLRECILGGS